MTPLYGTPVEETPAVGTTWTKRKFVLAAYEELAMAGYEFDLSPELLQAALDRLDAMMAYWYSRYSIDIGYPLPITADSDLDDSTDVEFGDNEVVVLNLTVRLAAKHGKVLPTQTKTIAKSAFDALLNHTPSTMVMPNTMPRGAGSKNWDFPFCDELD